MKTRGHFLRLLMSAAAVVGLLAGCSTDTSTSRAAVATRKAAVPAMGLCAFISTDTAGRLSVFGNTGPEILFASVPPASGQTASCEFASPMDGVPDLDGDITEISLDPSVVVIG